MSSPIIDLTTAVLAAVRSGRLSQDDGERALGRTLMSSFGTDGAIDLRRQLLAVGVEAATIEAALGPNLAFVEPALTPHRVSPQADTRELDSILNHLGLLGPPRGWEAPTIYSGVALAVIDSVWSIGVRYGGVLNVIGRYRSLRLSQGADADADTPVDLETFIEDCDGPEAFAEAVNNRQRTSSTSGILKAEAVLRQARMFAEEGISTPADLVGADPTFLEAVRQRWMGEVPGQSSGLSWEYALMLCGIAGVKADRMVRRFVADGLQLSESAVSASQAQALVRAAAERLGVEATQVDYAIWLFQRGR